MSRIEAVDPGRASERARGLLAGVKSRFGRAPNLTRVLAKAPAALEGYLGLGGALASGVLPADVRERLALLVAEANGCDYCNRLARTEIDFPPAPALLPRSA